MSGYLKLFLVLLAVALLVSGCFDTVEAKKGTHRVSRMISDTRPWFDCLSEDYAVGSNYVTCGDDTNDDTPPIQACIDAASAVNGVAYLGPCDIDIDTSIELNDPVTLMGCGANSSWGHTATDGDKACTTIRMDDDMATDATRNAACTAADDPYPCCTGNTTGTCNFPAIYVRGDPANGRGHTGASGDIGAQGIQIQGIKFLSESLTDGGTGIVLDGSYADELLCDEPGGCPAGCSLGVDCTCEVGDTYTATDTRCRGSVRDITITDTGCYKTGEHCFYQTGNVFDVTYNEVFSYITGNTGYHSENLGDGACNNSACRGAGQIDVVNGLFFSCARSQDTCNAGTWAVYAEYTNFFGGHIQGDYGASIGYNVGIYGTHIEADTGSPTAGNTGIQIRGRHCQIVTKSIQAFENNLVIGEDGSSNPADAYFIAVDNITNATGVGLTIEDGAGQRDGVMNIGNWITNAQDVDNQANKGPQAVVHKLIGKGFLNGAIDPDDDSSITLTEDDVRIGNRESDDQYLYIENSFTHTDSPYLMWDENDARLLFALPKAGTSTEFAVGNGLNFDQKLTFVDGNGDHTIHYDYADAQYEMDGPLKLGGAGSSITAAASNDLSIAVDDGYHFEPDTMKWKECADTASGTTITVDDCNMVTFTGTTAIVTINNCNAANTGRMLYVLCGAFDDLLTDNTGNLKLSADLTCAADRSLTLLCDGANWYEMGRSSP